MPCGYGSWRRRLGWWLYLAPDMPNSTDAKAGFAQANLAVDLGQVAVGRHRRLAPTDSIFRNRATACIYSDRRG